MSWLDIFGGDDTEKKTAGSEKAAPSAVEKSKTSENVKKPDKDIQKKKEEIAKEAQRQANKQKYEAFNTAINEVYKGTKKIEIKSIKEIDQLNPEEKKELIKVIKGKRNEIIKELSFEDKKAVIEKISNKSGLSPDDKLGLADMVLTLTEKQQWIRELLKNKTENKEVIKNKIMGFFRVAELVNTIPPYNRYDKKTPNFLAEKAGIKDYDINNREHNEKIRTRILDVILDLNQLNNAGADVLDQNHTSWLNELVVESGNKKLAINDALSTLSESERIKINNFTKEEFKEFIGDLDKIGIRNSEKITDSFGEGVAQEAKNTLGLNLAMVEIKERIEQIKNDFVEEGGNIKDIETKVQKVCDSRNIPLPIDSKTRSIIELEIIKKEIDNLGIDETKKQKLKNDAAVIERDIYTAYSHYEKTDELKTIRGEHYNEVKTNYEIENGLSILERKVDISIHAKTIDGKARSDFGNQIEKNSTLDQVQRLQELTNIEDASLLKFVEKEKSAQEDVIQEKNDNKDSQTNTEQDKKNIVNVKADLVNESNKELKTIFVNRVLTFVQDALDINIDQQNQDNILSQFKLGENQEFRDQKITLEGEYNGQKIILQYDMQTGNMLYQPYLSKKDETQDAIDINKDKKSKNFKPFVPSVKGPYINEALNIAKKINNQEVINNSVDKKTYAKNYANELQNKYPIKFADEYKDGIKQQYIKTILAQDMVDLLGKDISSPESVGKDTDKKLYPFYKMIYENTYERNGETNIQDLQMLRLNIQKMKNLYNNIASIEDSEAKQILDKLFSQSKRNQPETPNNAPTESVDKKIDFRNGFLSAMDSNPNDSSLIIDPKGISAFVDCVENNEKNKNNPLIEKIKNNTSSGFLADNFLEKNKTAWIS